MEPKTENEVSEAAPAAPEVEGEEKQLGAPAGGPLTFDEFDQMVSLREHTTTLSKLTGTLNGLIMNIIGAPLEAGEKMQLVEKAVEGFKARAGSMLGKPEKPMGDDDDKAGQIIADEIVKVIGELVADQKHLTTPAAGSFRLKKQADGTYRWVAVYTNNFKDRDADIIERKAHLDYIDRVNEGQIPFPELWVYHVKGTVFGDTDVLAWNPLEENDKAGFIIASGTVRPGYERIAEGLQGIDEPLGLSHGMKDVLRVVEDGQAVIKAYNTYEISVLPLDSAANPYTKFNVRSKSMPLTPKLAKFLEQVGFGQDEISSWNKEVEELGAEATGVAFKSQEQAQPENNPQPAPSSVSEDTLKETAQGILQVFEETMGDVVKALESIESRLAALEQDDQARLQKLVNETPRASLDAMLGNDMSNPIGHPDTQVDGRTSLGKAAPTRNGGAVPQVTDSPLINDLLHHGMTGMRDQIIGGNQQ